MAASCVSYSQCSVTTGPNLTRCAGQPAALGTGLTFTGASPVSFSWSNGLPSVQNPVIPATISNTYTVTITDANGCTSSASISLTVLPLPVVNAGADITICAGSPTTLCATATSSNGAISIYTWNGGPANPCYTVAPASQTVYSVTAADAAGCQKSDAVTVFVNPLPVVNAGADQSICISQGPVQLTGSPAGGTWSGSGVSSSGLFTPTSTGNFTLTYSYTNPNNCSSNDQMIMTVTSPSTPDGGADQSLCLNGPAVQLPNVGTWSGSALVTSGGVFTPSLAGTYNLTVTSGSGACTASDAVVVVVKPLPVVNAGNDVAICTGQSTQLNGTASSANGAITNTVWGGGWVDNASILNPNANPPSTTTYTLYITDAGNCQNSDQVVVTVNSLPTVNAGSAQTICSNAGPTTLSGQSPAGGTWSGPGVSASGVFTPGAAGTFTLTYTVSNGTGCSASANKNVTVIAPGSVNAGNDVTVCRNTPPFQLATGGTWSGSPFVSSGGLFTPSTAGVYNLTYTASTGLCTANDNLVVTVLSLPSVNAGNDVSICSGQTANLSGAANSANGAITAINWTGGSVSNNGILNPTTSPTGNINLTLTVTDVAGCQNNDQVLVTVNALPVVNAGSAMTVCSNTAPFTLTGQSPAGGTWSGTGVNAAGLFTPGAVGTYALTYSFTNSNGCSASAARTITVTNPGTVNAGNDLTICLNTLAVQLNSGGTWTGSSFVTSAGLFTPSAVGTYNLTYTASTGLCMASDDMVVTVLALPAVNAGNDATICAGQTSNLNATASSSNGAINSISWTGGSVSSNSILNPVASPAGNTTYTLSVTDVAGCQNSDQVFVTVNALPVVSAGSDQTVCSNASSFTLTGHSPAGGSWSGSGITAGGVFTPGAIGSFVMTYSFTNSAGCSASAVKTITVTDPGSVNAGNDIAVCQNVPPLQLLSGGTWTGSPLVTPTGLFTPSVAGIYTLTYTASTGLCMASDQLQITVNSTPIVDAGLNASVCTGNTHQLQSTVSGGLPPYDYHWSGSVSDDHDPNPTILVTGNTTLNLNVSDSNNCSASDNVTLTSVALPVPDFTIPAVGCVNSSITISNSSQFASSYQWDFGDGGASVIASPSHTFSAAGVYNVSLNAMNSLGCGIQLIKQIEVISAPVASFSLNTNEGCSPLNVVFNNQSAGNYNAYLWNINGVNNSDFNPAPQNFQAVLNIENFNIQLTATNICGSSTHSEAVTVNPKPDANFNTTLSSQCSPVTTTFINTSGGNPDTFFWDLGDGNTSVASAPSPNVYVTDQSSANFTIKLLAYNECGVDSVESVVTVLPNTVHINLSAPFQSGCSPLFVPIQNLTTGATNYHFDFGDGSTSSLINPNHVYTDPGIYNVVLNADDGCSFSSGQIQIEVLETPTVSITSDLSELCPDEQIQFSSTTTGDVVAMQWDFGDGQSAGGSNPSHTYSQGQNYFVSASVNAANGCDASASMSVLVHPKPDGVIQANAVSACSPFDMCVQTSNSPSYNYQWSIPGVTSGNSPQLCHSFTNFNTQPQQYLVHVDMTTEFGCANSGELQIEILPQPQTSFVLSAVGSCFEMQTINSVVTTTGASDYQWTVDGNHYSSVMSPAFQFSGVGEHIVEVVSTNSFGCSDTHSEVFTIYPTPVVDIMPEVFNGCMPLTVEFSNASTDGFTYNWTFGNGDVSQAVQPVITFDHEGLYDVNVQVTSVHGCQSEASYDDMIEVFPLPVTSFDVLQEGDVYYQLNIEFKNTGTGAVSYEWEFGDQMTSDDENPQHTYYRGGRYEVELTSTNEYGCESRFSRTINIDNTFYVYIPNSFTPGNDGINDYFAPVFSDEAQITYYEFIVVNRWGEQVFKTNDPDFAWNGSVKNGEYYVHNDTFSYTIIVANDTSAERKVYTGSVNVLR